MLRLIPNTFADHDIGGIIMKRKRKKKEIRNKPTNNINVHKNSVVIEARWKQPLAQFNYFQVRNSGK